MAAFLLIIPALLSLLIFSAHLARHGLILLVPFLLTLLPLLLVPHGWVARVWQCVLSLAVLEWVRTAVFLVVERQQEGEPWIRAVVIVGAVAALSLLSILLFESEPLLEAYPRRPLL